jgi:hypothetical protein
MEAKVEEAANEIKRLKACIQQSDQRSGAAADEGGRSGGGLRGRRL